MTPSLFPLSTDKLWFCCLSPNHKVLQYGDVEDNASPPAPESLPEQLPVADIRALLTGKDCPHIRDKGSVKQNKVRAVEVRAPSHLPCLPCSLLSAPGSLASLGPL